jgi:hypothetical protein
MLPPIRSGHTAPGSGPCATKAWRASLSGRLHPFAPSQQRPFGRLAALAWGWCTGLVLLGWALVTVQAAPPLGNVPGAVVAVSSNASTVFLGSPSLVILPDGRYVASYDLGGKNPRAGHVAISISSDRGQSWSHLAELVGQHWSTLFRHQDALWLIGVSTRAGHIQIRRSGDGGRTWTIPADGKSGVLATDGKFHCGPTPVLMHGGRVWRAFEEFAPTGNARVFRAFMMSAPAEADLLVATNWTRSSAVVCQGEWLNLRTPSWLEGNAVVTPAGAVADILRVESHPAAGASLELPGAARAIPRFEVAAMLEVTADGRTARFDPLQGFIHFIGSESKFTIRYDPVSHRYWSLGNKITNPRSGADWEHSPHHQRNVIALTSSADLRDWREHYRLLRYDEGSVVVKAGSRVGFQYLDWQFDGQDIVAVCRTSWGGANYHDANYITFHRLKNFRAVTMADSPPDLAR